MTRQGRVLLGGSGASDWLAIGPVGIFVTCDNCLGMLVEGIAGLE